MMLFPSKVYSPWSLLLTVFALADVNAESLAVEAEVVCLCRCGVAVDGAYTENHVYAPDENCSDRRKQRCYIKARGDSAVYRRCEIVGMDKNLIQRFKR